jgi:hypothetical protein
MCKCELRQNYPPAVKRKSAAPTQTGRAFISVLNCQRTAKERIVSNSQCSVHPYKSPRPNWANQGNLADLTNSREAVASNRFRGCAAREIVATRFRGLAPTAKVSRAARLQIPSSVVSSRAGGPAGNRLNPKVGFRSRREFPRSGGPALPRRNVPALQASNDLSRTLICDLTVAATSCRASGPKDHHPACAATATPGNGM